MACPPSAPLRPPKPARPPTLLLLAAVPRLCSRSTCRRRRRRRLRLRQQIDIHKRGRGPPCLAHNVGRNSLQLRCTPISTPLQYRGGEQPRTMQKRVGPFFYTHLYVMIFPQLNTEIVSIQICKGGLISECNSPAAVQRMGTVQNRQFGLVNFSIVCIFVSIHTCIHI